MYNKELPTKPRQRKLRNVFVLTSNNLKKKEKKRK